MATSKPKSTHAHGPEGRLSMAMENYLLTIFRLEEQGVPVTLTQLAEHLKMLPVDEGVGTSLPSVGAMIRRMVKEDLVETGANKQTFLTRRGRTSGESIVRRHRLAERLVVDLLGMEPQRAHIEAHLLEHAISPELEKKIIARLGEPTTCPFGHPIPGSNYHPPKNVISMEQAETGQELVIDRIPEDDQELLEYFVAHDLIPGQHVVVKEAAPMRGVLTLMCRDQEVVFSYDVASSVWAYSE